MLLPPGVPPTPLDLGPVPLEEIVVRALQTDFQRLKDELLQVVDSRLANASEGKPRSGGCSERPLLSHGRLLHEIPEPLTTHPPPAVALTHSPAHAMTMRDFLPVQSFSAKKYASMGVEVVSQSSALGRISNAVQGRASLYTDTALLTRTLRSSNGGLVASPRLKVSQLAEDDQLPGAMRTTASSLGTRSQEIDHVRCGEELRSAGKATITGTSSHIVTAIEQAWGYRHSVEDFSAPSCQDRAASLVTNPRFELLSFFVIIVSSLLVAVQTDIMARQLSAEPPTACRIIDLICLPFFIFEVCLRLYAYRARFFYMRGSAWWNILDLSLVVLQVLEEIANVSLSEEQAEKVSSAAGTGALLRVVRGMRVVRVVRILHVMRVADELRVLASCVTFSFKTFFWAGVMLFIILTVVGVHITQFVLLDALDRVGDVGAGDRAASLWFGNVARSILSLFQGLTGGVDWNELVAPLMNNVSPWLGVVFFFYMAFATLSVMNLVTGIFVQQAIERAKEVQEMQKVTHAGRLFNKLDVNHNGCITLEEIENNLEAPEVLAFFGSIDVDVSEAKVLFSMLDHEKKGSVEFGEFLSGCLRLQGPAKAIDLVVVMREVREAMQAINRVVDTFV